MRGHFFRECPRLDATTKALLLKAYEERMAERPQDDQRRPKQTFAAVGTSLGPPWSSSDDTPPPGVEAEALVQDTSPPRKTSNGGGGPASPDNSKGNKEVQVFPESREELAEAATWGIPREST